MIARWYYDWEGHAQERGMINNLAHEHDEYHVDVYDAEELDAKNKMTPGSIPYDRHGTK